MNKCVKAALFAAVLCFMAAEAFAYRLGQVDITLRGGVSEIYDDNITYAETKKKSDFITKPTLGFNAAYEGKATSLSITGNYYHEFYIDNSGFDNDSGDATAILNSELSKFDRISIKNSFTRTYEPRSFEDQFGFIGDRYNSTRNRVDFNYAHGVSRYFDISTRYSNEYNSYSRSDIPKSFLNTASVECSYIINSDLSFFSAYDFSHHDFDEGQHATTNTWTGGFRKFLTKQVYIDASAGLDFIRAYNGDDFTKPFGLISIMDDISDRTNVNLLFTKRYNTLSYLNDIFDQWQVSASLNHELLQKLTGALSAFYGRGEYVEGEQVDKLTGSSVELVYEINDKWRAMASYSFSKQNSTSEFSKYRKNIVTLSLTAEL